MKGGFSFCGTDIGEIGLEYAPELEDTYVYRPAKHRIHEETYDGHNGGYFYGVSKEPKEFILRCLFDEKDVDRGFFAKVSNLFRVGRTGKLVFDRRPWCYYLATVTDLDDTGLLTYYSGTIKITMKAYYPYGRSDAFTVNRQSKDYYRIVSNTAMFEDEAQMPTTSFCQDGPVTEKFSLLLANPGTERAAVGIELAGDVGKGVRIYNETTDQSCKFVAMSEAQFDGENYVFVDGLNGKTTTVIDGEVKTNFLYHDEGFIELKPAFPAKRNIQVNVKGTEAYTINKLFDRNIGEDEIFANFTYKGKYLWADGWHEIESIGLDTDENSPNYYMARAQSEHIINLKTSANWSGTSLIYTMNKIIVEPVSTMKLTRLNFIYKPTFS